MKDGPEHETESILFEVLFNDAGQYQDYIASDDGMINVC